MKITYDWEFLEDGRTIAPISLGLVREDGYEYYAVNRNMPVRRIRKHDWLMANVVPHLPQYHGDARNALHRNLFNYEHPAVKPIEQIAKEVRQIIQGTEEPELWAYYGAYDHVTLCQLWGRMVDLPEGVPMYTNDIKQELKRRGLTEHDLPPQKEAEHNALADARHNMVMVKWLEEL